MREVPELVNISGLAIAGGKSPPTLHRLRTAAARHVAETDLHSLPSEPPQLLRCPWLVEASRPDAGDALFGDTFSLGGYTVDRVTYLVGLTLDGGAVVAPWHPTWTGGDIAEGTLQAMSPLIPPDGHAAHQVWARAAARFAVVYSLLAEAEGSPLRLQAARARDNPQGLAITDVYLDGAVGTGQSDAAPVPNAIPGLVPEVRAVKGHLRRQRHGPELSLVKWIYVAQHGAWRWVRPL
ncbi:hypothetical protein LXT21_43770 [Myxococcus sp. K38C18041901]|uniref:hypothetical protein n=1 Tax=Myxococcus guangdongensis TaxID=2906760 RepID=UPI0020A6DDD8|nr:hypothetical protein [Myxococcus guangdongensis]MCP3065709.1 hypothetical protein [Myxococcus guangdongensis]